MKIMHKRSYRVFILRIGLIVLIKLLLQFGSIWKFLSVSFVYFLPDVSKLIPQVVLEVIGMDIESLIIVDQVF
jgi:hypothetical protein